MWIALITALLHCKSSLRRRAVFYVVFASKEGRFVTQREFYRNGISSVFNEVFCEGQKASGHESGGILANGLRVSVLRSCPNLTQGIQVDPSGKLITLWFLIPFNQNLSWFLCRSRHTVIIRGVFVFTTVVNSCLSNGQ